MTDRKAFRTRCKYIPVSSAQASLLAPVRKALRIGVGSLLLWLFTGLSGCSSTAEVKIASRFPEVLSEPKDIRAAVVFEEDFRKYVARPDPRTQIDIGEAQVALLTKAFSGLFKHVQVLNNAEERSPDTELLITPSVREVQVSAPSETYLNVYEVWIKYSLKIENNDQQPVDSWFLPAYGKTPDSFMMSRSDAIENASVVALRDAGAKLLLDFYRIPAIYAWMGENGKLQARQ